MKNCKDAASAIKHSKSLFKLVENEAHIMIKT